MLLLVETPFLGLGRRMTHAGSNSGVTPLRVCRSENIMYVHCIRSWQFLGHSRRSARPLSSLKGFTLELLKLSYACTCTAAVSSAWTAVAGSSSLIGIGSSKRLGLLWRPLVVTCLFVPRRNRKIYWGYVVQPENGALVECM